MAGSAREVVLSLVKAGLSATSPIGGAFASLLGDGLQAHTDRSLKRAMELLEARLKALEQRIDLGAVDRDELAELFKSCYLLIRRTHQEEKLRGAAALLANLLLRKDDPDRMSYTELDHFARCLDILSMGAIQALGRVYEMLDRGPTDPLAGRRGVNFADLEKRMPGTSPDLLMGLVSELNAMNLIHIPGPPSIRTANYVNYPIELTPLGTRFVTRLLLDHK